MSIHIRLKALETKALNTAKDFLRLLEEMEITYNPRENINKRWIYKDQAVLKKWISELEAADSSEDYNALWQEVQNISRILGCTLDDELGRRYRLLQTKLFEEISEVISTSRSIE